MADRTLCGIVRDDGTDCRNPLEPTTPLNLCREHLAAAYLWVHDAKVISEVGAGSTPRPYQPLVYYVALADRIKIGTTTDLPMRLRGLTYDKLLAVEPGSFDIEKQRHRRFQHARIEGEWFRPSRLLLDHIKAVKARHPQPVPSRGH